MLVEKARIPIKQMLLYGFLPNFLKILIYRIKGYKIGKKVSIGFGSIICGDIVTIGNNSKFGFFSIVRGDKIKIGSHVTIGSSTFIDTPIIQIGDDTRINEQVYVGGLQSHDSKFVLGKNCQVMQMTFINPAKSVVVGDDSGIGGHCLIFGHASWQSVFEGYAAQFDTIEIGNSVSITWRVFLMPGSKIGDGTVVAPNSLVNRTIPPKSLVAGYPARVIKKHPDFPDELNEQKKKEILEKIVKEMIDYFIGSGMEIETRDDYYTIHHTKKGFLRERKQQFCLGIKYSRFSTKNEKFNKKNRLDVLVSLAAIPTTLRAELNRKKVMWLDIENKERPQFWNDLGDEVALFLRRYGVRFTRVDR